MVATKTARQKGQNFERRIAADMTKYVGVQFRRTPQSGAWDLTGDITPQDPGDMTRFKFSVECKCSESLSSAGLFKFSDNKMIMSYWKQCVNDSRKKIPLLIFTKANFPVFVMTRMKYVRNIWKHHKSKLTVLIRNKDLAILLWDDFLTIPYDEVVKCMRQK